MIGQTMLRRNISQLIEYDEFPRFSILVGAEGSGKKTLTNAIAFALNCQRAIVVPKVDVIREMIKDCYKVQSPVLYVIIDSDKMSPQAKNAMLKVCEETPNNAYIMMLVNDIDTVLPTIKSRACVFAINPYTNETILEYAQLVEKVKGVKRTTKIADIITDLCETPGDVNKLYEIEPEEFYSYVEKVIDNIAEVSGANALKIASQIDFKGDNKDKYDMTLFLRAFKSICGKELRKAVTDDDIEMQMYYSAGIKIATKTLQQMQITGINKSALFDMFILDIRQEWC